LRVERSFIPHSTLPASPCPAKLSLCDNQQIHDFHQMSPSIQTCSYLLSANLLLESHPPADCVQADRSQ
jgi:hypothetical protein